MVMLPMKFMFHDQQVMLIRMLLWNVTDGVVRHWYTKHYSIAVRCVFSDVIWGCNNNEMKCEYQVIR